MGVAVQSHWFAVGGEVPWAEAGVGAVATQSFIDPSYGPLGLNLMRAGKSAPDALHGLLIADDACNVRQVAMVDTQGRVATFTGAKDIEPAGGIAGCFDWKSCRDPMRRPARRRNTDRQELCRPGQPDEQ